MQSLPFGVLAQPGMGPMGPQLGFNPQMGLMSPQFGMDAQLQQQGLIAQPGMTAWQQQQQQQPQMFEAAGPALPGRICLCWGTTDSWRVGCVGQEHARLGDQLLSFQSRHSLFSEGRHFHGRLSGFLHCNRHGPLECSQ